MAKIGYSFCSTDEMTTAYKERSFKPICSYKKAFNASLLNTLHGGTINIVDNINTNLYDKSATWLCLMPFNG